jgi:hypothetical protein
MANDLPRASCIPPRSATPGAALEPWPPCWGRRLTPGRASPRTRPRRGRALRRIDMSASMTVITSHPSFSVWPLHGVKRDKDMVEYCSPNPPITKLAALAGRASSGRLSAYEDLKMLPVEPETSVMDIICISFEMAMASNEIDEIIAPVGYLPARPRR